MLPGRVDVAVSEIAPADRLRIVFLACDVRPRTVEQGHHLEKAPRAIQARIDGRMIIEEQPSRLKVAPRVQVTRMAARCIGSSPERQQQG